MLSVLCLFLAWAVLSFFRASINLMIVTLGATLFILSWLEINGPLLLTVLWLIYLAKAVTWGIPTIRRAVLSRRFFKYVANTIPPISKTEQEALDAGDVWWEAELFSGKPEWPNLLEQPKPKLTQEEQSFLDNQVEQLCSMLDEWEITTHLRDLPERVWQYLKDEGFFAMVIPKEFGGLEFSALAHSAVVQKIASRSLSAAVTTMVPNSLGPAELLIRYGTQEQKQFYLPKLAKGQELPCFALTSPQAGSDAGGMIDKGIVCRGEHEGKELIGIRLTWDKRYITLAPKSTVLGLAFKLYDPEKLLGDETSLGITLCLLPTTHPGVEVGNRHLPADLAFLNGPTRGKDVFIPMDWIIGGQERIGHGWRMLMECLSIGRSISLPAISTASCKVAYVSSGAYSVVREQFKVPLVKLEGVEFELAKIAGLTYLVEATSLLTTHAVDQGNKPSVASAIAKYHTTEIMREVLNAAVDIHAGRAVQYGPRNYLARSHQGIPVCITVEGANILTRNLIIFGQGVNRCHPYLQQELAAVANEDSKQGLVDFDRALVQHIAYSMSNFVRCFVLGVTTGRFSKAPKSKMACYYQKLNCLSAALASVSEVALLVLGGALKRKENLSARLGDVLSSMYLVSATLKYFSDQGEPETDESYVKWISETYIYKAQVALRDFINNFPNKAVRIGLRLLVMPFGLTARPPSDELNASLVAPMLHASSLRERLSQWIFTSDDSSDPLGRLESALTLVNETQALFSKFRSAIKTGVIAEELDFEQQINMAVTAQVLSEAEAQQLLKAEMARFDANAVDEFTAEQFSQLVCGGIK